MKRKDVIKRQIEKQFGFEVKVVTNAYGRRGNLLVDIPFSEYREIQQKVRAFCLQNQSNWQFEELDVGILVNPADALYGEW